MSIRKGLVLTGGQVQELPSGASLAAILAIANTETQVVGLTVPANALVAGTVIKFEASGVETNGASPQSIHRIRIGPITLTGPIVASWSGNMGLARTNAPFRIWGDVTILSATSAIATIMVLANTANAYPAPTTTIVAPVVIATNAPQIVQLTTISGATTCSWSYYTAWVEYVKP